MARPPLQDLTSNSKDIFLAVFTRLGTPFIYYNNIIKYEKKKKQMRRLKKRYRGYKKYSEKEKLLEKISSRKSTPEKLIIKEEIVKGEINIQEILI